MLVRDGLICLAIVSLLLAACDQATTPDDTGAAKARGEGSVLRRGIDGEPESLDPHLAVTTADFEVLFDLYEGLTTESPDGEIVPGVAESWETSEDGKEYTFTVRPDARWSNGDEVLSTDFVSSFRRLVTPATGSPNAFFLFPIRNAEAITAGTVPPEELGVEAIDPHTLKIDLIAPTPYFLKLLSHTAAFPVHRSALPEGSGGFSDPGAYVSNGAYRLEEWQPLSHIRLGRNPHYWDRGSVNIHTVFHYPNTDSRAEFDRFRAGELDVTSTVPPTTFAVVAEDHPDALRVAPYLSLYYYAFDLSERPFNDRNLRRALSMAIDRERLVEILGRGELPANGFVPPGVDQYENIAHAWSGLPWEDRLAEARELYAAAGYSDDRPLDIELSFNTGDVHETVALIVSEMWRANLGVRTRLNGVEWQLLLAMRADRSSWELMRFSWTGDYNDASTFAAILHSESPQNLPGYSNSDYDRLLDEASRSPDPQARRRLLESAEALMLEDQPILPLYFPVSKHLVGPRVGNFRPNILDHHFSRYLRIVSGE